MKNKHGLTLIELIVSIALISIVMVFMFQLLTELRYQDASDTGKVEYKVAATILTKEIQNILLEEQIESLASCDTYNSCLMITFVGGNTLELSVGNENQVLNIIKRDASDNILIEDVRQIPEKDETGYLGKYDDFGYSTKYFDPVNGSYDYKYDSLMEIELNLYDSLNNVYPVVVYYPYEGGTNFSSFSYHTLTVLTDGGTWSGTTPQTVAGGESVTINNPTKTGYLFTSWTVSGTGSSMDGTTFTMGTEDTTITANWALNELILTVVADGGTWSGTTPQTVVSGSSVTINNPTKAGYVFTGWTVNGTGSSMDGTTFTMGTANTTITANWLAFTSMYTYTGTSSVLDDGSGNFRIKFLTSGTFTPLVNMTIDVFLVGGGGGGGIGSGSGVKNGGSGGGGGYTATYSSISLTANTSYGITIGAGGTSYSGTCGTSNSGGTTSAFTYSASGGAGGQGCLGSTTNYAGGIGGNKGGTGGGYTGATSGYSYGAVNQGSTTCEFGQGTTTSCNSGVTTYAGGGGGGAGNGGAGQPGGITGGGDGHNGSTYGDPGTANTGGGGGGAGSSVAYTGGGTGGTGIVIIRNHQ